MHPFVHSSVTHSSRYEHATYVFIDRRMDEEDVYLSAVEYYSAVKRKKSETMPFAAMWMGHVERQLDDN